MGAELSKALSKRDLIIFTHRHIAIYNSLMYTSLRTISIRVLVNGAHHLMVIV